MNKEVDKQPEDIRILSVLQLVGHPRDSKRVAMLKEAGFDVEAVAFEREYHSGRLPECNVESLGKIANGRYLQRVLRMVSSMPALRRAIRRNDLVYASGQDVAIMALVASLGVRKPIIMEIGDIRELQVARGLKGLLIRYFDRRFVNACSFLVVTAPGFVDNYYRKWLRSSVPAMVIENKVESDFVDEIRSAEHSTRLEGRPLIDRPLRIGYFGGLRCEWSWRTLAAFAKARPKDVQIVLAGMVMNPSDLEQQVGQYDNIEYLGEYKSPQDLPSLYGNVDLVWGCYQHIGPDDWNLRWARPNRFYESCAFQVPLVSRAGSCDAIEVERLNIGLIINDEGVQRVVDALCEITPEQLETWKENMTNLPRRVFAYTTEIEELRTVLLDVARKRGENAAT